MKWGNGAIWFCTLSHLPSSRVQKKYIIFHDFMSAKDSSTHENLYILNFRKGSFRASVCYFLEKTMLKLEI